MPSHKITETCSRIRPAVDKREKRNAQRQKTRARREEGRLRLCRKISATSAALKLENAFLAESAELKSVLILEADCGKIEEEKSNPVKLPVPPSQSLLEVNNGNKKQQMPSYKITETCSRIRPAVDKREKRNAQQKTRARREEGRLRLCRKMSATSVAIKFKNDQTVHPEITEHINKKISSGGVDGHDGDQNASAKRQDSKINEGDLDRCFG